MLIPNNLWLAHYWIRVQVSTLMCDSVAEGITMSGALSTVHVYIYVGVPVYLILGAGQKRTYFLPYNSPVDAPQNIAQ